MFGTYLSTWVSVMIGILFVLGDLLGVLLPNFPFTHLLADTRIELAHLTTLSDRVASFAKVS